MKKTTAKKAVTARIPQTRTHFQLMLAQNPNYFGNVPGSKLKANLKQIANTTYEQLTCVGYNPDTALMEATFVVKKSTGYSGSLCTAGSFEYVRFYLDFHDGAGFIDQGSVAVNVHDIPEKKDCEGKSTLPLTYSVMKAKISRRFTSCHKPSLPTLLAILSWNVEPPADSPGWNPPWGNRMECDVQIKPYRILIPDFELKPDILDFLTLAVKYPDLSVTTLAELSEFDIEAIAPKSSELSVAALKDRYKAKVPASRFAYKAVHAIAQEPLTEFSLTQKQLLSKLKIDISDILDNIGVLVLVDKTKANVDYEELKCIGLDYHKDKLVASISIKKKSGYSGDLCDDGSKEYVAFWIDWNDDCKWEYLDTVELNVHDIDMKSDQLCYQVTLPLNAKYHRKLCTNPNLVRVRGVLSWNVPPSTTNPNALNFYGNRVDAHIQVRPGPVLDPGVVIPLFNIIGGVDIDHVNDLTGLTKPGSFFAYNAHAVPTGAAFGGTIVLNGPSFPGYRYRIRITNLNTGVVQNITNSFVVVGDLPVPPYVQYTTQAADGAGYYPFLPDNQNTLNVLARFNPGTQDKFLVEMEVDTVPGVFSKTIRMDNKAPDISIQVDDGGDCTKYKQGDTITGRFFVSDLHIWSWNFGSTWGGGMAGSSNTPPGGQAFSIPTTANAHPCGRVSLHAVDKVITNSQGLGHHVPTGYNVCLKSK